MADFGYHYPAGAANDPRAPWNQDENYPDTYCGHCDTEFDGYEHEEGTLCPECGDDRLTEIVPPEPCYCGTHCVC